MQFTGKCLDASLNMMTGKYNITFEVNEKKALLDGFDKIKDCKKLKVEAVKFRERRSLDANALLWSCLGKMAEALMIDKWDVYLLMLKRYGKFTHMMVEENAVEATKQQWRECEIVGDITLNGKKFVQMLAYFGSSKYNTKEFSHLLDGVVSEMKEMGLEPPLSKEMRVALERWDKQWQKG